MKAFTWREIVRSDRFLFLEKVSLSLVSGQKDCLTSLRCLPLLRSSIQLLRSVRQPSFFPTTAESETFSRKKIGLHSRSLPGKRVPRQREYIFPRFPFFYFGSLDNTSIKFVLRLGSTIIETKYYYWCRQDYTLNNWQKCWKSAHFLFFIVTRFFKS